MQNLHSKITSTLLSNREYIISSTNLTNPFISTGKKQYSLAMFIKLNKITLYVNFNKRKREYMIIPIIPIGAYIYIYTKITLLITLLAKNIAGKFLSLQKYKWRIK